MSAGRPLDVPESVELQPREKSAPCPTCGHHRSVKNGAGYRNLRLLARVKLSQVARIRKLSKSQLSRMEHGVHPFDDETARLYERLFDRRRSDDIDLD